MNAHQNTPPILTPQPDLENGPEDNNHSHQTRRNQLDQQQRESTGNWLVGSFIYRLFCAPTSSIPHQIILLFSFAIFLPIFMIFFFVSAIILLIRSALGYDPPLAPPTDTLDQETQQVNPSMVAVSALINEFAPNSATPHPPLPRRTTLQRNQRDPDNCLSEKELEKLFPVTTVAEFLTTVKSVEKEPSDENDEKKSIITDNNSNNNSTNFDSSISNGDDINTKDLAEPPHATTNININTTTSTTNNNTKTNKTTQSSSSSSSSSSRLNLSHHLHFPKFSSSGSKAPAFLSSNHQQSYTSTSLMCPICQIQFGHEHDDEDGEENQQNNTNNTNNTPSLDSSTPLRVLHCGHAFHDECIRRWLCHIKPTCPLCNRVFVTKRRPEPTEYFEGYFWI
ncbi:uncharacterized protein SAPINGB_P004316 [Magnusiomyces paraingens]|uniref:RING-type domain-containing protein n=1 Tax=Magnusiomyces paraingens TaxID=2606893 RepID=A0A5E8C1B2_9ASCO|nr:uncharacterized protein SAPINGB_P004316 [Saprochaete ingens]VVT54895.1 unnamed protein product [Saprochaete ingens]